MDLDCSEMCQEPFNNYAAPHLHHVVYLGSVLSTRQTMGHGCLHEFGGELCKKSSLLSNLLSLKFVVDQHLVLDRKKSFQQRGVSNVDN